MRNTSRAVAVIGAFCILASSQQPAQPRKGPMQAEPVYVDQMFIPSGYMGDGEKPGFVQVRPVSGEKPRPGKDDNLCIKVTYKPGPVGWAGVYWQYPAQNWGDQPGRSLRGKTKLVFWAAGLKGGEIVQFKAGGITGKKYHDSFEATIGSKALTKDWKEYVIDLSGKDLSSVIGAFAWVATGDANPGGLTFYLDDIRFE